MQNEQNFNEDSMSLIVDDRFFQSQSGNQIQLKSQPVFMNAQNQQGISQLLNFPQKNNLLSTRVQKNDNDQVKQFNINQILANSDDKLQIAQRKSKKIQKIGNQIRPGKNIQLLQKKKQNSKNYRQRKKQYFERLQQQHQYYKRKTLQLEQKVKMLQQEISQLKYDKQNYNKTGFQKQFQSDMQYLKTKQNEQIPNDQLIKIALSMRQKYGPAGKDRRVILNYFMNQYINATLSDYQKYILISALDKTGPLFGKIKTKLDKKIEQIINLNQKQKQQLKQNYLQIVHQTAISFCNCCKNIYKSYVQLLTQAKNFHDKMAVGFNILIVPQMIKLVFWFHQNRNRTQVRKLKQQWIRMYSGQKVKQQEQQSGIKT